MNEFDAYRRYVNPVLAQLEDVAEFSRHFVRAEGCYLWDREGKKYLDLSAGHGSLNLGHNPPAIVRVLTSALQEHKPQIYGLGPSPAMGALAAKLANLAGPPFEIAFFANSGTEAVEGGLKICRAATRRAKIAYCRQAYHGTTLGGCSMMAEGPLRDPFEPLLPGFIPVPFNDWPALEKVLQTRECAAFVLEPIQVEAGVVLPAPLYLENVARLCKQTETLLVFDEVATGLARTGSLFFFQQTGVVPDLFTLAKSLGGGLMPIGAYLTSRAVYDRAYGTYEFCGVHHSTFGGNTLSCLVALAALDLLADQRFLNRVQELGRDLLVGLQKRLAGLPLVHDIRGQGLLLAVDCKDSDHPWLSWENLGLPEFTGHNALPSLLVKRLLKKGFITQVCGHNWDVLKIQPPLTIEPEELTHFVDALREALQWLETIS